MHKKNSMNLVGVDQRSTYREIQEYKAMFEWEHWDNYCKESEQYMHIENEKRTLPSSSLIL